MFRYKRERDWIGGAIEVNNKVHRHFHEPTWILSLIDKLWMFRSLIKMFSSKVSFSNFPHDQGEELQRLS